MPRKRTPSNGLHSDKKLISGDLGYCVNPRRSQGATNDLLALLSCLLNGMAG